MDHGLAAPYDLDSLRSKVEGRFESIDRLSNKGLFYGGFVVIYGRFMDFLEYF